MGWGRRKSRCSWCYETGHNKRTCPARQSNLESRVAQGSRWAAAELARKNHKSSRKCGWCGEKGHNKRTCTKPAEAKDVAPLLEETLGKLVAKAVEGIGRGSIVGGSYNKNCVVLCATLDLGFGASSISEQTLELHRDNTDWLARVIRSLITRTRLHCVTPKGTKCDIRLPLVKADFRDRKVKIGTPANKVAHASATPIECKVNVEVQECANAKIYKGWVAVTNLLLDETTWSRG